MRDNYRKNKPKPSSKLSNGLMYEGKDKEVTVVDSDTPIYAVVFSITDTAKALGRTVLTIRRWIAEKLIPPPRLACTSHGYMHYSEGELKLIAKILSEHEEEYNYLHHTHVLTINRIWQHIEAYRKEHI